MIVQNAAQAANATRAAPAAPTGPTASSPAEAGPTERPTWRGRIHQVSAAAAIPLGLALVIVADGTAARLAALVYATTLVALFATSATYHRITWSPQARRIMRRLDHSMIYLLIAGTYTPFALLVLHGTWSIAILAIVWTGAIVGIVLKMVMIDRLKALAIVMYIVLGWVAVLALPQILSGLSTTAALLLVSGGVLYTVGAVLFVTRRPNPLPGVFGYHEVWHALVAGAGLCHYLAVATVLAA